MSRKSILVSAVLAVGICVSGCQSTQPTKWEYKVVNIGSDWSDANWFAAHQRILSEFGAEGWVLVEQHKRLEGVFYLKRARR